MMRNLKLAVVLWVTVSSVASASEGLAFVKEMRVDRTAWASRLGDGAVKALAVAGPIYYSNCCTRDMFELAERMEMKIEQVSCTGGAYMSTGTLAGDIQRIREKVTTGNYDVYAFGGAGLIKKLYPLPPDIMRELLAKVRDGKGLVLCGAAPFGMFRGQVLSRKIERAEEMLAGLPRAAMARATLLASGKEESACWTSWSCYQFGKGRIAVAPYVRGSGFLPDLPSGPQDDLLRECLYSVLGKVVLWASGQTRPARITGFEPADGSVLKPAPSLDCTVICQASPARQVQCGWQLRSEDNEIVGTGVMDTSLKEGESKIQLSMPSPGSGQFCLDVWLRDKDTTLDWGSCTLVVKSAVEVRAIRLWKPVFREGEPLTGQVEIVGARTGDKARLSVFDSYGRKHVEAESPLLNGVRGDFRLEIPQPADRVHQIRVAVISGETVLARASQEVTILPAKFPGYVPSGHYLGVHIGPRARCFQAFGKYYGVQAVRGATGMETSRYGFIPEPFPYHLGNDGSYNDAQVWAMYRNSFTANLPEWKRSGVGIINLGDDSSIQRRLFKPDFKMAGYFPGFATEIFRTQRRPLQAMNEEWGTDFKDWKEVDYRAALKLKETGNPKLLDSFLAYTRERSLPVPNLQDFLLFRQYLGRVYPGGVKTLNREWGTSFGNLNEITPRFITDCQKAENPAPWVDYLLYQVDGYCEVTRHLAEIVRREIPDICLGQDASKGDEAVPYIAGEGKPLTYYMPYFSEQKIKTLRHWLVQMPCGGVTMGIYRGRSMPKLVREKTVMFPLANQLRGLMYWKMLGAFDGNMEIADHAREGLDAIRECATGLANLVLGAEWERSPVALFYSPVSEIASTLDNELSDVESSRAAFRDLTEDLGFQTETIGPLEVVGKELFENGYKVFVLPYAQAMSEKEAEAIRSFVFQGGTLVADTCPAVQDEHCKPLAKGLLDGLFGIERVKPDTKGEASNRCAEGALVIGEAASAKTVCETFADATVKAAEGKALGRVGDTPAFIVNHFGAGRAILLNTYIGTYPRLRDSLEHESLLGLWRDTVTAAGVTLPAIKVSAGATGSTGYDIYRYHLGSMALLGLVRKPWVARADAEEEARIEAPRDLHAYECRSGKYLGSGRSFRLPIRTHELKFIALLPYQVQALKVSAPQEVVQGGELTLALSLEGASEKDPGHPVFVRLVDPKGQTTFYFDRTVRTRAGKAQLKHLLALNERTGTWQVHARDAATGIEGSTEFVVKAR